MENKTSKSPLQEKILARAQASPARVFTRRDFEGLGSYGGIGNALRQLVKSEDMASIGYGFYARMRYNNLARRRTLDTGLPDLGREALTRLGFETCPTRAEIDYNANRSTQVPTGRRIGVRTNKRITRRIGYGGARIYYEYRPNA